MCTFPDLAPIYTSRGHQHYARRGPLQDTCPLSTQQWPGQDRGGRPRGTAWHPWSTPAAVHTRVRGGWGGEEDSVHGPRSRQTACSMLASTLRSSRTLGSGCGLGGGRWVQAACSLRTFRTAAEAPAGPVRSTTWEAGPGLEVRAERSVGGAEHRGGKGQASAPRRVPD